MKFYLLYKNRGLYDPVVHDYEPIYEPYEPDDFVLQSQPTEVPNITEPIEIPVPDFRPIPDRSLTASPHTPKPYRPFSTEPVTVPPVETPIILNPAFEDVFKTQVEEPVETIFKLPVSEQYDAEYTRKIEESERRKLEEEDKRKREAEKKYFERTFTNNLKDLPPIEDLIKVDPRSLCDMVMKDVDTSSKIEVKKEVFTEEKIIKEMKMREEKEEIMLNKELEFIEQMKQNADKDIRHVERTALDIVDDSIERALSVTEEIKKEIDKEFTSVGFEEAKETKTTSSVEEIKPTKKTTQIKSNNIAKTSDKTTEEIVKESKINVEENITEIIKQNEKVIDERRSSLKQEIEKKIVIQKEEIKEPIEFKESKEHTFEQKLETKEEHITKPADGVKKSDNKVEEIVTKEMKESEFDKKFVEERKVQIKQDIEETIEAGSVKRKSMLFDKDKERADTIQKGTVDDNKKHDIKEKTDSKQSQNVVKKKDNIKVDKKESIVTEKIEHKDEMTTIKQKPRKPQSLESAADSKTYKSQSQQRVYEMGLQTIPNIRGVIHTSCHFDMLLRTFFVHLTDVMVALSRFMLTQPSIRSESVDTSVKQRTEMESKKDERHLQIATETIVDKKNLESEVKLRKDEEKLLDKEYIKAPTETRESVREIKVVEKVQPSEQKTEAIVQRKQETIEKKEDKVEIKKEVVLNKQDIPQKKKDAEEKREKIVEIKEETVYKKQYVPEKKQDAVIKTDEKVVKEKTASEHVMTKKEEFTPKTSQRKEFVKESVKVSLEPPQLTHEEKVFLEKAEQIAHKKRKTGAMMSQLSERKSPELTKKLGAVISEFERKASTEEFKEEMIMRSRRSRSRSQFSNEEASKESQPLSRLSKIDTQKASKQTSEVIHKGYSTFSQSKESKKYETAHKFEEHKTTIPKPGKQMYIAIVESHVYTNKNAIFEARMRDERITKSETRETMARKHIQSMRDTQLSTLRAKSEETSQMLEEVRATKFSDVEKREAVEVITKALQDVAVQEKPQTYESMAELKAFSSATANVHMRSIRNEMRTIAAESIEARTDTATHDMVQVKPAVPNIAVYATEKNYKTAACKVTDVSLETVSKKVEDFKVTKTQASMKTDVLPIAITQAVEVPVQDKLETFDAKPLKPTQVVVTTDESFKTAAICYKEESLEIAKEQAMEVKVDGKQAAIKAEVLPIAIKEIIETNPDFKNDIFDAKKPKTDQVKISTDDNFKTTAVGVKEVSLEMTKDEIPEFMATEAKAIIKAEQHTIAVAEKVEPNIDDSILGIFNAEKTKADQAKLSNEENFKTIAVGAKEVCLEMAKEEIPEFMVTEAQAKTSAEQHIIAIAENIATNIDDSNHEIFDAKKAKTDKANVSNEDNFKTTAIGLKEVSLETTKEEIPKFIVTEAQAKASAEQHIIAVAENVAANTDDSKLELFDEQKAKTDQAKISSDENFKTIAVGSKEVSLEMTKEDLPEFTITEAQAKANADQHTIAVAENVAANIDDSKLDIFDAKNAKPDQAKISTDENFKTVAVGVKEISLEMTKEEIPEFILTEAQAKIRAEQHTIAVAENVATNIDDSKLEVFDTKKVKIDQAKISSEDNFKTAAVGLKEVSLEMTKAEIPEYIFTEGQAKVKSEQHAIAVPEVVETNIDESIYEAFDAKKVKIDQAKVSNEESFRTAAVGLRDVAFEIVREELPELKLIVKQATLTAEQRALAVAEIVEDNINDTKCEIFDAKVAKSDQAVVSSEKTFKLAAVGVKEVSLEMAKEELPELKAIQQHVTVKSEQHAIATAQSVATAEISKHELFESKALKTETALLKTAENYKTTAIGTKEISLEVATDDVKQLHLETKAATLKEDVVKLATAETSQVKTEFAKQIVIAPKKPPQDESVSLKIVKKRVVDADQAAVTVKVAEGVKEMKVAKQLVKVEAEPQEEYAALKIVKKHVVDADQSAISVEVAKDVKEVKVSKEESVMQAAFVGMATESSQIKTKVAKQTVKVEAKPQEEYAALKIVKKHVVDADQSAVSVKVAKGVKEMKVKKEESVMQANFVETAAESSQIKTKIAKRVAKVQKEAQDEHVALEIVKRHTVDVDQSAASVEISNGFIGLATESSETMTNIAKQFVQVEQDQNDYAATRIIQKRAVGVSQSSAISVESDISISQSLDVSQSNYQSEMSANVYKSIQESTIQSSTAAKSLSVRTDLAIEKKESSESDENNNTPSPTILPPTPLTDEYVFRLETPLPRVTTPIPPEMSPDIEDPHIVKKNLIPYYETTVEPQVIFDPPLPSPPVDVTPAYTKLGLNGGHPNLTIVKPRPVYIKPGLRGGGPCLLGVKFPVYVKPGLRGGADKVEYTKEEIREIERKSSLLASAIDETIKSIEEYKEEVGIDTKKEVKFSKTVVEKYTVSSDTVNGNDAHEDRNMEIIHDSKKNADIIEVTDSEKLSNGTNDTEGTVELAEDIKDDKSASDIQITELNHANEEIVIKETKEENGKLKEILEQTECKMTEKEKQEEVIAEKIEVKKDIKTESVVKDAGDSKENVIIKQKEIKEESQSESVKETIIEIKTSNSEADDTKVALKDTQKDNISSVEIKVTDKTEKSENKIEETSSETNQKAIEDVEKNDPMKGFRPVKFDPESIKPRRTPDVLVNDFQEPNEASPKPLYKTETGELLGTVQGIVDGLEEAVVDEEVAKELGKPGITEERIAELISGEAEMLREAHVMGLSRVLSTHMHRPEDSSVDFQKIKPIIESLRESEVLKALNEEVIAKEEAKKREEKKWTTFLQKPKRPMPRMKFGYYAYLPEEKVEIEEPYKVKIVKQPKPKVAPDYKPEDFDTGPLPWEERAIIEASLPPIQVELEEPILIPEEQPQFLEAVDPLPESEVPDLEDTGIPLPTVWPVEPQPPQVVSPVHLNGDHVAEDNLEVRPQEVLSPELPAVEEATAAMTQFEQNSLAEQLMLGVKSMVDPNATLEQQLAQMRAQLAALAQLPGVIQQTLELVTQQLMNLTLHQRPQQEPAKPDESSENIQEDWMEDVPLNHTEVNGIEEEQKEPVAEDTPKAEEELPPPEAAPALSTEEYEALKREEEDMMEEQRRSEKQKKEQMERARFEMESRQIKQRSTPRVGKPRPAFGPPHPQERPVVLPGGRRWRSPRDAYNDQMIAETIQAQSELIQGKVLGPSFESDILPYDDRINFMKYEKPPPSLDHLQRSEVYKMIHDMDQTPLKRVELLTPVIAEADYRERVRSLTPSRERIEQYLAQQQP